MNQQLLTRCPNCETLFKLYPRQIEAAGGFVRCGSCMKVFKAHKHILDPSELPSVAELSSISDQPPSVTINPQHRHGQQHRSGQQHLDGELDLNSIYQNLAAEFSKQQNTSAKEADQAPNSLHFFNLNGSPIAQTPSLLKEPTLKEPTLKEPTLKESGLKEPQPKESAKAPPSTPKKPRLPQFTDDFSDSFKSLPKSKNEPPAVEKPMVIDEIDESWAEKMLDELDEFKDVLANDVLANKAVPSPRISQPPAKVPTLNAPPENNILPKSFLLRPPVNKNSEEGLLNAALADNLIKELSSNPPKSKPATAAGAPHDSSQRPVDTPPADEPKKPSQSALMPRPPMRSIDMDRVHSLSLETDGSVFEPRKGQQLPAYTIASAATDPQVTASSVDEDVFHSPRRGPQTSSAGYSFGCLLLTLIFICLYGYYNFHPLNQIESIRPAYVMACKLLDCLVPPRQNIHQIVNLNVIVQQHPTVNQALRANVLIKNQADYAQPFPQLKLTFTDLHQQVVAERIFVPSEYQKNELSNLTLMPSQQSIRLMFDFWDPGETAVSSELSICQLQNKVLRCKT